MTSKDIVARKLQELIDSQSNFQLGQLTSSASTGGTVTAKLPNGRTVTAKAGNDCSGGQCSLFRLEDGTYIAMSGNASSLISQQTTTFRQSRTTSPTESGKYLKVLFSKVEDSKRIFYIGGDRSLPEKVHETSESDVVRAAYISATGEGKDKWVVALALQAGTAVTIWHITATESEKRSWTDANNEIFPLLTYNGFGMWSAGTFIAPTMQSSKTTATSGDAETITTTYTVDRPSFVTGNGSVIDTTTDRKRKIKKAEVCYDTFMQSGACVPGPPVAKIAYEYPSTFLGPYGSKSSWQGVMNFWIAWRKQNPGVYNAKDPNLSQAWVDSMLPFSQMPPRPANATYSGGLYAGVYHWRTGNTSWSLEDAFPFMIGYSQSGGVTGWGRVEGEAVPVPYIDTGNPVCEPSKPVIYTVTCPIPSYDSTIPGQTTRTIAGGYSLGTFSYLINNGEYSALDGTIRLAVSGSGVSTGPVGLVLTTSTTYSYQGTNWLDRTNTSTCSSSDVSIQIDTEPPSLTSNETREVCLAVGRGESDRITFIYYQSNNDRKEDLYWNGIKLETPLGFVMSVTEVEGKYSSSSSFISTSKYVGVGNYPSAPDYTSDIVQISGMPALLIESPPSSTTPLPFSVRQGTIQSVSPAPVAIVDGAPSGVVTIQSLDFNASSPALSAGSGLFMGSSNVPFRAFLALSLNSFTGLLSLPTLGYCDLVNPYFRGMSMQLRQSDLANKYQNFLLNVVRSLGDPTYCFYDEGKILVSSFPDSNGSYCYRKEVGVILTGKFSTGGTFSWDKPETREVLPLLKRRDDTTFVVHSTTAWF